MGFVSCRAQVHLYIPGSVIYDVFQSFTIILVIFILCSQFPITSLICDIRSCLFRLLFYIFLPIYTNKVAENKTSRKDVFGNQGLQHRPQKLGQYMQTIPMCRSGLYIFPNQRPYQHIGIVCIY